MEFKKIKEAVNEYYQFLACYSPDTYRAEKGTMVQISRYILERSDALCFRDTSSVHFTVSALVLSDDGGEVLLNRHRKHGRWKHFGGHIERSDLSLEEAMFREIEEETGLTREDLAPGTSFHEKPVDIQLIGHEREHLDIDLRYLFVARAGAQVVKSEESDAVMWVPAAKVMAMIGKDDNCHIERLLAKADAALGGLNADLHFVNRLRACLAVRVRPSR